MKTKQNGYTLIELLLYVSITATLLLGVSSFYAMTLSSRIKNQSIVEVDQQATAAMDMITQTVRNASGITSPVSGSSSTLSISNPDLSPTIFELVSGVVQLTEGLDTPIDITGGKVEVTELTFTNVTRPGTSGSMRVEMTVSRINSSGRNEYDYAKSFSTTVSLRP